MQGRTIHVYLLKHNESQLFVAVSAELSGLVVHGNSPEDIERRLEGVIRDLLEAEGQPEHEKEREQMLPVFG